MTTPQNTSNPHQTDLGATGLSQDLSAPTSQTTPHNAADAARAMSTTGAWQPRLDRRQSWDAQEYKHLLHKPMQSSAAGDQLSAGFTERR